MTDKEIALVREARPAGPPYDPAAKARAWARLHAEFEPPATRDHASHRAASRRRLRRPLAAAGAVAAGAATAIVVSQVGGTTHVESPQARVTSSLPTLELAAVTVEHQALPVPRPEQWVYTRRIIKATQILEGVRPPGPEGSTIERWEQYGFPRTASVDRRTGRLTVTDDDDAARGTEEMQLPRFVRYVNGLPTDPDALLRQVRKDSKSKLFVSTVGTGDTNGPVFQSIALIFKRDPFVPPKVNAALFRMLNNFPGVRVEKQVTDAAGRTTIGIYRDSPGENREEILFDPKTFRYRGSRSIAVHDFTSDSKPKLVVKAGQMLVQDALLSVKVTDRPGQR